MEQRFFLSLMEVRMPDVAWQQHNNLYTASISDFRAVITERHDTATFAAQVETVDREILREWEL
jgi:hypothetical protein